MPRLDVGKLYLALDEERQRRAGFHPDTRPGWQFTAYTWRRVAQEARISPSTLSRLAAGHRPDADGLVALLGWLGTTDLRPYITEE